MNSMHTEKAKLALFWIQHKLMPKAKKENLSYSQACEKVSPQDLSLLIDGIYTKRIDKKVADQIYDIMWEMNCSFAEAYCKLKYANVDIDTFVEKLNSNISEESKIATIAVFLLAKASIRKKGVE